MMNINEARIVAYKLCIQAYGLDYLYEHLDQIIMADTVIDEYMEPVIHCFIGVNTSSVPILNAADLEITNPETFVFDNIVTTSEDTLNNVKKFDAKLIDNWEYAVRATVSLRNRNKDYRKIRVPFNKPTSVSALADASLKLVYEFIALIPEDHKKYEAFLLRFGIS